MNFYILDFQFQVSNGQAFVLKKNHRIKIPSFGIIQN